MKVITTMILLFLAMGAKAQEVKWAYTVVKPGPFTREVHLTATIARSWHIYAQGPAGDGPVPTTIRFTPDPAVMLTGPVKEAGEKVASFEPAFNMEVNYYENKVDFIQRFQLKADPATAITGTIEYMSCTESHCLPPKTILFNIPIQ